MTSRAALVGAVMLPAGAQVGWSDVEAARERLRVVSAELEEEVAQYEAAALEEANLRDRLDQIVVDLAARERELVLVRRSARDRVAEMYMAAGTQTTSTTAMMVSEDFGEVPAKLAYLDTLAATDRQLVNQLEAARNGFVRQQELLEETTAQQVQVREEMESALDDIYTRLEAANAEYQAVKAQWEIQEAERIRREEEERLRRERELFLSTSTTTTIAPPPTAPPSTSGAPPTTAAAAGQTTTTAAGGGETTATTSGGETTTTSGGETTTTSPPVTVPPATTTTVAAPAPQPGARACPVDGATTFRDSWGEPRPGDRAHTGTDMMAATGTPLVAIEGGYIWNPNWHYAGGLGLYINGDSGDRWYYAHMDSYAGGIRDGLRVEAGQLVGFVGSSGNASVPHLHIAHIAGGTTYVNPYPTVAALCR
jgi:murein DD-endopeptidase MepM/ murein hydrolase activator NlpD